MEQQKLGDIFAMSGYAAYVWGAFGTVIICLLLVYLVTRRRLKKALQRYDALKSNSKSDATRD